MQNTIVRGGASREKIKIMSQGKKIKRGKKKGGKLQ